MSHSLLFIPDISGYTQFVQSTEIEHSQHVIAELLEILINANNRDLKLAEVEGDALFFYLENKVLSQEHLLALSESMFTAFHSHLNLLRTNRICPCNACATAPDLELKIIAHCGDLSFIEVGGSRKPFGQPVIEAHRLLKNHVDSDNYVLITDQLAEGIGLKATYSSKLYQFQHEVEQYDGKDIGYLYSVIDTSNLHLSASSGLGVVEQEGKPRLTFSQDFSVSSESLYEVISNFRYRDKWVDGVDSFEYDPNEVNRIGTEHACVINSANLEFKTITKTGEPGQLIYGEHTTSPAPVDEMFQYFIITPTGEHSSRVDVELYYNARSPIKKLVMRLFGERSLGKSISNSLDKLGTLVGSLD